GIAGVQTGLAAVWTEAMRRGIALETILPRFTTGPAAIVRLADRGVIAPGAPAHLAVFDPDVEYILRADDLQYRHRMSPWQDARLRGAVTDTYLHGRRIWTRETGLTARTGQEIIA
ncbi:amidohydrolase family protein, partial [Microbacterium sp.]|uniref:amidohydrolase family protein n=2 Tax=Microbacteriaceae TaxID=85023 RepID=UPI003F9D9870